MNAATMKVDIRGLDRKLDTLGLGSVGGPGAKLDLMTASLGGKLDAILDDLHSAKIWGLLLCCAQTAVLVIAMAKGFGWLD